MGSSNPRLVEQDSLVQCHGVELSHGATRPDRVDPIRFGLGSQCWNDLGVQRQRHCNAITHTGTTYERGRVSSGAGIGNDLTGVVYESTERSMQDDLLGEGIERMGGTATPSHRKQSAHTHNHPNRKFGCHHSQKSDGP